MEKGPRILFMGTPEFAVASLGALLMNNYNVVAVVSVPDKPAGRGRSIKRSAVAEYAIDNCLNLLQPANLKDPTFLNELKYLRPDIAIVVAFRMLPELVWQIPTKGTFNLHASLLPQYRGAAPINHAIINGEKSTGITTFLIDHKIDTGNIILREEFKIGHRENAGELHDILMRSGAKLVLKTVDLLTAEKVKTINQSSFLKAGEEIKMAPKIFTKDCFIDWSEKTETIYDFIRGLSPYPGARTMIRIGDKELLFKILEAEPGSYICSIKTPGHISSEKEGTLFINTADGSIELLRIQAEGKKVMTIADYLRGIDPSSIKLTINHQV